MLEVLLCSSAMAGVAPPPLVELASFTTSGQAGQDGNDEALDVVLDQDLHAIAVGYLDGAPGHGTDAYLVHLLGGQVQWEQTWDSGEVTSGPGDSDDRLAALAVPEAYELAFCGRLGSPASIGAAAGLDWLLWTEPDPHQSQHRFREVGSWARQDGKGSAEQSCLGLARRGTDLVAVGASAHLATDGRWWMHRVNGAQAKAKPPDDFAWSDLDATVEERALDVAIDAATGDFAVVGDRASPEAGETDAYVRYYNADGTLRWDATFGVSGTSERAVSVAFAAGGELTVSFHELSAHDNGEGGVVRRFTSAGDGLGGPEVLWTFEVGGFEPVIVDGGDEVWVGAAPPVRTTSWNLTALWAVNGLPHRGWNGLHKGPVGVHGIAYRDGVVALAGYVTGPDGSRDFAVTLIDQDSDYDGVADTLDGCPHDTEKTEPGICGCGIGDRRDRDGDGTLDCVDACAEDPDKAVDPGVCGCGVADVDLDRDGALDCEEGCPDDADKTTPGPCGCGVPDIDSDDDGSLDCVDDCPSTPSGVAVDAQGCPELPPDGTCGCQVLALQGVALWMAPALALTLCRRRRQSRPSRPGIRTRAPGWPRV